MPVKTSILLQVVDIHQTTFGLAQMPWPLAISPFWCPKNKNQIVERTRTVSAPLPFHPLKFQHWSNEIKRTQSDPPQIRHTLHASCVLFLVPNATQFIFKQAIHIFGHRIILKCVRTFPDILILIDHSPKNRVWLRILVFCISKHSISNTHIYIYIFTNFGNQGGKLSAARPNPILMKRNARFIAKFFFQKDSGYRDLCGRAGQDIVVVNMRMLGENHASDHQGISFNVATNWGFSFGRFD